jgi:uncharacterized protein (DUF2236 family)
MGLSNTQEAESEWGCRSKGPVEPLGPDALTWQRGFPRTGLLIAGRALLLQVMHPVVGAGVRDFSDFKADPWGRLDRTLVSLQVQMFGGAGAVEEAERLRRMHRSIRGVGFAGQRYRALDPQAYAWVHLSNFDSLLAFDRWFARDLSAARQEQLYTEWRQVGRVLGIRETHMPPDVTSLRDYVAETIEGTLCDNPTVREVLDSLQMDAVGPPPWPYFPAPVWRALRPLGSSVLHDTTIGTLPDTVRRKLALRWTPADQLRLRALAAAVRAASRPVPARLMQYPLGHQAQIASRRYRSAS